MGKETERITEREMIRKGRITSFAGSSAFRRDSQKTPFFSKQSDTASSAM